MWTRLKALIVKELLAVLRDPKSRTIIIVPPLVQLLVFSYAATLEVKNVDLLALNHDSGHWSQELIQRIQGAPTFRHVTIAESEAQVRRTIDMHQAIGAVVIGPTFSRDIASGAGADLQVVLDGRRSNAAQIVGGYLGEIAQGVARDAATASGVRAPPQVTIATRNWFNPNLTYQWFLVPNLIALIALLIGLLVTALSVARERELGTFDQLMVSPLRVHEVLLGKVLPPILIGLFHITLYVLAAIFMFHVPLRGALPMLYVAGLVYLAAVAGVGLFISSLSMTQQQAILGAFLFLVPATLLSGFATPIENMPTWLQPVTAINPLRYFLVVVRGVFLRDMPISEILAQTLPLALIASVTLTAAAWLFRHRME
jgi:ABC-2 type transport system permease protein